jgi:TolA-binding protein
MAIFRRSEKPPAGGDDGQPAGPTEEDIAKAKSWFARGREMAEKKNYDYAIECYISGLEFWPDAVEEGHKPVLAAALFRGPQKVSFGDTMKFKTNDKDPKKAMLNAERLLAKEPRNPNYMEPLFRNAAKARLDNTVMWIGEQLWDAASREEKPSPARFQTLREVYEELSDRLVNDNPAMALEALQRAYNAQDRVAKLRPQDMQASTEARHLAGKLTILKGKYGSAESFRDSVRDSDTQREIHDKERLVQSDERLEELIANARREYEANPTDNRAISNLVELLCRRENEADELKAIDILVKAYKDSNEYRHRVRAEDIRIKQLNRRVRNAKAKGDAEAYREARVKLLSFELDVYKNRVKQYPTDLRLRYELGRRLFQGKRYDDAIPMLQEARSDPKTRTSCSLYIGRCFYEKGYYAQAIDILREAIAGHDIPEDELGKDLQYWLGRSQEGAKLIDDALKTYGQLIQWDYNYRDVRKRIDDLHRPSAQSADEADNG